MLDFFSLKKMVSIAIDAGFCWESGIAKVIIALSLPPCPSDS